MLLSLHALTACFMAGLIWQIQCVQYPLFRKVPEDGFIAFHADYVRRIGRVIFVAMPLEMLFAVYLLFAYEDSGLKLWVWAGLVCLALIWLSTAFIQAPLHRKLQQRGYQSELVSALIRGNWIRTALWSFRAILALKILS